MAFSSTSFALDCEAGSQLYRGACTSNSMVDLITCIDATGGNKQQLVAYLDQSNGANNKGGGSIAAGNRVASGKVELQAARETESRAILALGARYFEGATKVCAAHAEKIISMKSEARPGKGKSVSPPSAKLPVAVIASGGSLTFFPGFTIVIRSTSSSEDPSLTNVNIQTPENGTIMVRTDNIAWDISHKGVNYKIRASLNKHNQIVLTLSQK
ncbi:hypothetical protein [Pseudoduganella aquatica]|uniref:Uncharacterized protein n=1 Tax=Pseudoduganella aquatica TaxID=2660641 RepID=A0A7X4HHF9_9BURK|nr:hypothetical protein [Pseudoduganella aquatica]MYN11346.1 hypothetical protein [Pseudoduganella aquatica]